MSEEFADAIRIWLASIPTAAEVYLRPDAASPGILPYREKSAACESLRFEFPAAGNF